MVRVNAGYSGSLSETLRKKRRTRVCVSCGKEKLKRRDFIALKPSGFSLDCRACRTLNQ